MSVHLQQRSAPKEECCNCVDYAGWKMMKNPGFATAAAGIAGEGSLHGGREAPRNAA